MAPKKSTKSTSKQNKMTKTKASIHTETLDNDSMNNDTNDSVNDSVNDSKLNKTIAKSTKNKKTTTRIKETKTKDKAKGKSNGKVTEAKGSKKKDKLSYRDVKTMDIMSEFSERNRDIIIKFPSYCIDNVDVNKYDHGNLKYNPKIIDPSPISDMSPQISVGQSIVGHQDNMPIGSTELTAIQQDIYNNYITAGSNANIDLQKLIDLQNSMIHQHNLINNDNDNYSVSISNNNNDIPSSTPITSIMQAQNANSYANNGKNDQHMNGQNMNEDQINNMKYTSNMHNSVNTDHISQNNEINDIGCINKYQKKIDDLLSEFSTPDKKRSMTQIEILLHKKYNQTKQIELMYTMCHYVNTYRQWPKTCTSACLWDSCEFPYMPWGIPELYDVETGKFSLSGVFCSPNCALAHIMHEEKNTGSMWEKISLLNLLYHKVYQSRSFTNSSVDIGDADINMNGRDGSKKSAIKSELESIDAIEGLTQLEKRRRKKFAKYRAKIQDNDSNTTWGTENLVAAPDKRALRKFGGPLTIEQYRCLTLNNDKQYQIVFPPCDFVAPVLEETKKVFTQESNFIPADISYMNRLESELKIKRTMPVSTPKISSRSKLNTRTPKSHKVSSYHMPAAAASRR